MLDGAAAVLGEAGLDFGAILTKLTNIFSTLNVVLTAVSLVQVATEGVADLVALTEQLGDFLTDWGAQTPFNAITALTASMADLRSSTARALPNSMYNLGNIYDAIAAGGGANQDILDAIAAVRGTGDPDLAAVLTAIAGLPAGATPSDVWTYVLSAAPGTGGRTADAALSHLWLNRRVKSQVEAVTSLGNPHFVVEIAGTDEQYSCDEWNIVTPDYADIQESDTVLTWLQRTETSGRTWELDETTSTVVSYTLIGDEYFSAVRCILHDSDLRKLGGFAAASEAGPPLWPGAAGVTLGTPVDLTVSAIVDGPMDGILVAITSSAPGAGSWEVDTFESVRYAGYVVFLSAEGHADTTQFLGPTDNVFCPKTMQQAGSCVVHLNKVLTATVTPWTLA
jgi:hypothetical protein